MITEHDLDEAIALYQGKLDPNSMDCMKLASCFIVKNEMYGGKSEPLPALPSYSYAPAPASNSIVSYDSGTEFSRVIQGKQIDEVFKRLDNAFEELRYLNPKIYNAMLDELV